MKDRRKQLIELYETYIEELENHTTPHKAMKAMIESVKAEIKQEKQVYDIDCNGHIKIQISIKDNIPSVLQAMNGYGEPEDVSTITVLKT